MAFEDIEAIKKAVLNMSSSRKSRAKNKYITVSKYRRNKLGAHEILIINWEVDTEERSGDLSKLQRSIFMEIIY